MKFDNRPLGLRAGIDGRPVNGFVDDAPERVPSSSSTPVKGPRSNQIYGTEKHIQEAAARTPGVLGIDEVSMRASIRALNRQGLGRQATRAFMRDVSPEEVPMAEETDLENSDEVAV